MNATRIDYWAERMFFVSIQPSARTRKTYEYSLRILEAWLESRGLSPIDLTPERAGDFVHELEDRGRIAAGTKGHLSPSTVQTITKVCTRMYSSIEKRFAAIKNPFSAASKGRDGV
jgi:site-specific recombinase XerD